LNWRTSCHASQDGAAGGGLATLCQHGGLAAPREQVRALQIIFGSVISKNNFKTRLILKKSARVVSKLIKSVETCENFKGWTVGSYQAAIKVGP
jgi:hypothetical protein